ncbi:MAG: hypothetical protein AAGE18_04275 [Pseudomonadota bacterium]
MRVILHIGPGKTATSTIQHELTKMRRPLARAGWLYPRTGLLHRWRGTAQHGIGYSLVARPAEWQRHHRRFPAQKVWPALTRELARARRCDTALISSESMANLDREALERIPDLLWGHEVEIVLVEREPLARMESLYAQVIKAPPYSKAFVRPFLRRALPKKAHEITRALFEQVFSPERVRIVPYEALLAGGSVGARFLDALGGPELSKWPKRSVVANKSPDWSVLMLLRSLNTVGDVAFEDRRKLYAAILAAAPEGDIRADPEKSAARIRAAIKGPHRDRLRAAVGKWFALPEIDPPLTDAERAEIRAEAGLDRRPAA